MVSQENILSQYRTLILDDLRSQGSRTNSLAMAKINIVLHIFDVPYNWSHGSGIREHLETELKPLNEKAYLTLIEEVGRMEQSDRKYSEVFELLDGALCS